MAIGIDQERSEPRFPTWPRPTLYSLPVPIVPGVLRASLGVLSAECGLLPLAVSVGANVYSTNTDLPPSTLRLQPIREGQRVILETTNVQFVTAAMILAGFEKFGEAVE